MNQVASNPLGKLYEFSIGPTDKLRSQPGLNNWLGYLRTAFLELTSGVKCISELEGAHWTAVIGVILLEDTLKWQKHNILKKERESPQITVKERLDEFIERLCRDTTKVVLSDVIWEMKSETYLPQSESLPKWLEFVKVEASGTVDLENKQKSLFFPVLGD